MKVRDLLRSASYFLSSMRSPHDLQVVILMYHRVTGDVPLELDLAYEDFSQQMYWLAEQGRVIALDDAVAFLQGQASMPAQLPAFVITFDDAYRDFKTHAFPLLQSLNLPATLYVPTGFIDHPDHPPITRKFNGITTRLQPLTWAMLAELAASPLITIGAHTHHHLELPTLSDHAVIEECTRCNALLSSHLGLTVQHFAYPRGIINERVEGIARTLYKTAVLAGGGAERQAGFNAWRISRTPVLRSDGMRWFEARIKDRLVYEERLVRKLKNLLRREAGDYG